MKKKLAAILISLCLAAGQAAPAMAAQFPVEPALISQAADFISSAPTSDNQLNGSYTQDSLMGSLAAGDSPARLKDDEADEADAPNGGTSGGSTDSQENSQTPGSDRAADTSTGEKSSPADSSDESTNETSSSNNGGESLPDASHADGDSPERGEPDSADSSYGGADSQETNGTDSADTLYSDANGNESGGADSTDASFGDESSQETGKADSADGSAADEFSSEADGANTPQGDGAAQADTADSSIDESEISRASEAEAVETSDPDEGDSHAAKAIDSEAEAVETSDPDEGDSHAAKAVDSTADSKGSSKADAFDSSKAGSKDGSKDNSADDSKADSKDGSKDDSADSSKEDSPEEDVPMTPALTSQAADSEESFSSAAPVSGQTYLILCAYNQSLLVDLGSSYMTKGSNVRIFKNKKYYRQYFTFIKNSDKTWTILNYKSSKVLAVSGTVKAKANVYQWEDKGKDKERWILKKNADGSYSFLTAADTSLAIEVSGGQFTSGRNLRLQKYENVQAEHFVLKAVSPKNMSGTIMLRPVSSPKMALGSRLGLTSDGNTIVLADAEGLSWQKYKLTHVYGGYYTITNVKTGLALALKDGKFNSGTQVIQTACTRENAQLWKPWTVSSGVLRFTSRLHSERVLGVNLSSGDDSFALSRVLDKSNKNQQFLTASCTSDQDVGTFAIRSCLDTDRVIEPSSSSKINGLRFLSRDWSGSTRQFFKMLPAVAGGKRGYYYRLVNASTGKLLTVKGNKATAGTPIVTGTWTGAKGQLWHPVVNSNGTITLVSALKSSLALELKGSSTDYDASLQLGKKTSGNRFRWQLTSMIITSASVSAKDHSTVTVKAKGTVTESDDGKIYLFAVNGYSPIVNNYKPRMSQIAAGDVTFTLPISLNSSKSLIQKRFYLGILKDGKYVMASNGFYLTNPEAAAARTTAFPKAASKKGLKLTLGYLDLAVKLNCSHAVLDFPLETYLNGSDFAYKYQGKTYYFSSAIKYQAVSLKKFHDKGIVVTGIFYLSSKLRDYIQPTAASSSGGGTIYALNTKNGNRKRLEALFSCLAEEWTKDGIYVANWVYGNESDQYRNYNFTGDVTYNQYHESWAEGFRLFNAAIKSRWKNARTYVSLDHNWNLPENGIPSGTYNGQQLIADFNTDLLRQGGIHWDMCMHPYPSPEQDCRIWVRTPYVTDSASSPQITPLNAGIFAAGLKATYGSSMHVILPETGISSVFQGVTRTAEQAAAVALAYYLTEFDSNLDMIGIHREKDNSAEIAGGWHLGLYYNASGFSQPKPSANVFRYMDTKSWKKHTKAYLKYVTQDGTAIKSWTDIVPSFKSSKLSKTPT